MVEVIDIKKENVKQQDVKQKRNMGLDILKVVSMIMIVTLHFFNSGGYLDNTNNFTMNWYLVFAVEALCFVSVNCYVLISGYFLVDSKAIKLKKVFNLIGQVYFYNLIISIIYYLVTGGKLTFESLMPIIFPFFTKRYWFMNVYIALYILHPFLNKLINVLNKKQLKTLVVTCILLFSLPISLLIKADWTLDVESGYSIIWFVCLYFISAYIRKYVNKEKLEIKYLFIYFAMSLLIPLGNILIKWIVNIITGKTIWLQAWYSYNSIPVLIGSVCLLLFFKNIKINNKLCCKIVSVLSATTLGVYLIHQQFLIRVILYSSWFGVTKYINTYKWIVLLPIVVLSIYIICTIIEYIRQYIVRKIFKKFDLSNIIAQKTNILLKKIGIDIDSL